MKFQNKSSLVSQNGMLGHIQNALCPIDTEPKEQRKYYGFLRTNTALRLGWLDQTFQ